MPALAATIRRSAARATLELPFSVPAKDWFTLREVAAELGISESWAHRLEQDGLARLKAKLVGAGGEEGDAQ